MKRMQMLQDLRSICTARDEASHNCGEVKILLNHEVQEFIAQNTAIREYDEFVHFLGHLMIECYELGYKRKCSELEEGELEQIFKTPMKAT